MGAEFTGLEDRIKAFWLPKVSDDIWRGSLRHEDWRPVKDVFGAWEPRLRKLKPRKTKGRGRSKASVDGSKHTHTGTATEWGGCGRGHKGGPRGGHVLGRRTLWRSSNGETIRKQKSSNCLLPG